MFFVLTSGHVFLAVYLFSGELVHLNTVKEGTMKKAAKTSAPDVKSLDGTWWAGECPIHNAEMRLNNSDLYECPNCHLQIRAHGGGPDVMSEKGSGQYRERGGLYISAVDELPGVGAWKIAHDFRVAT